MLKCVSNGCSNNSYHGNYCRYCLDHVTACGKNVCYRNCECGKEYQMHISRDTRPYPEYCSMECDKKYNLHMCEGPNCTKRIHKSKKYCSEQCENEYNNRTHTCNGPECNKAIPLSKKYCSAKCEEDSNMDICRGSRCFNRVPRGVPFCSTKCGESNNMVYCGGGRCFNRVPRGVQFCRECEQNNATNVRRGHLLQRFEQNGATNVRRECKHFTCNNLAFGTAEFCSIECEMRHMFREYCHVCEGSDCEIVIPDEFKYCSQRCINDSNYDINIDEHTCIEDDCNSRVDNKAYCTACEEKYVPSFKHDYVRAIFYHNMQHDNNKFRYYNDRFMTEMQSKYRPNNSTQLQNRTQTQSINRKNRILKPAYAAAILPTNNYDELPDSMFYEN